MLGSSLKDSKDSKGRLAKQLFADFASNQPSTRRNQEEGMLMEAYKTNSKAKKDRQEKEGIGFMGQLFNATSGSVVDEFYDEFTFGKTMMIWRKGRPKTVIMFIDQNLPNLLWATSPTKAFLFDLTHTTLDRCDYELEQSSGCKHYFILHYFE